MPDSPGGACSRRTRLRMLSALVGCGTTGTSWMFRRRRIDLRARGEPALCSRTSPDGLTARLTTRRPRGQFRPADPGPAAASRCRSTSTGRVLPTIMPRPKHLRCPRAAWAGSAMRRLSCSPDADHSIVVAAAAVVMLPDGCGPIHRVLTRVLRTSRCRGRTHRCFRNGRSEQPGRRHRRPWR